MTGKPYITCRQLIDFIVDYVDGSLNADAQHEFERHLGVCPSCVAYLETYRQTMSLTRLAISDETLEDVPEVLVSAILARRT